MQWDFGNIGHIIQLSVAPVFLLAGVGTKLTVLTNRLARVIDRSRVLEDRLRGEADASTEELDELELLDQRGHLINRAIGLTTACGFLICIVVSALFIGNALGYTLDGFIAAAFTAAMLSLIGSFMYLLREVTVATRMMAKRVSSRRR